MGRTPPFRKSQGWRENRFAEINKIPCFLARLKKWKSTDSHKIKTKSSSLSPHQPTPKNRKMQQPLVTYFEGTHSVQPSIFSLQTRAEDGTIINLGTVYHPLGVLVPPVGDAEEQKLADTLARTFNAVVAEEYGTKNGDFLKKLRIDFNARFGDREVKYNDDRNSCYVKVNMDELLRFVLDRALSYDLRYFQNTRSRNRLDQLYMALYECGYTDYCDQIMPNSTLMRRFTESNKTALAALKKKGKSFRKKYHTDKKVYTTRSRPAGAKPSRA